MFHCEASRNVLKEFHFTILMCRFVFMALSTFLFCEGKNERLEETILPKDEIHFLDNTLFFILLYSSANYSNSVTLFINIIVCNSNIRMSQLFIS